MVNGAPTEKTRTFHEGCAANLGQVIETAESHLIPIVELDDEQKVADSLRRIADEASSSTLIADYVQKTSKVDRQLLGFAGGRCDGKPQAIGPRPKLDWSQCVAS